MKNINLNGKWIIKAPLTEVFNIMTDFSMKCWEKAVIDELIEYIL